MKFKRKTKYQIHPDFKKWNRNINLNPFTVWLTQKLMSPLVKMENCDDTVTLSGLTILSEGGKTIRALLYAPVDIEANAPCLVCYHGGGFVMPAAPHHFKLMREYAVKAACKVLFVDYRLAPKHPFPAAVYDCWLAYQYIIDHASGLSIDINRVAVGGDSAGGQLAAVVCLMAKDRKKKMPCGQMMIFPVTGKNEQTESMRKFTDTPMCNSKDIEKYQKLYIQNDTASKHKYASPVDAESFEGLAPAYVETAEFDCLRDGGILYAERLRAAGVPAELNNTEGTMHGFDVVLKSPITRACVDRRVMFLKRVFEQPVQTDTGKAKKSAIPVVGK